ncbi:MAG: VOC family protein [Flavobacteriales bacterium]|nr:VOC family protein [Flavobacteriales bacterium]
MLTDIHPKLPMRNKVVTKDFYTTKLGFQVLADYDGYLIVSKDQVEIHFFAFPALDPAQNYGQVYIRTNAIESLFADLSANEGLIHPNGHLTTKPWGQREFSILDPDNSLLTFGQEI